AAKALHSLLQRRGFRKRSSHQDDRPERRSGGSSAHAAFACTGVGSKPGSPARRRFWTRWGASEGPLLNISEARSRVRYPRRTFMGFATDAIHIGQEPEPATGAIVAPIFQTSTYVQEALGKDRGFDYARTAHPNRRALERCVARLEGGQAAYVFTSGMAAIDALFRLLRPGDHTLVTQAIYGGVYRLTTQLLRHFGMEFSFVDTSDLECVRRSLRANTKMIYVETPTNPTMIISDIAGIARIANEQNITVTVDNTFLSPYLQRPLELGARSEERRVGKE